MEAGERFTGLYIVKTFVINWKTTSPENPKEEILESKLKNSEVNPLVRYPRRHSIGSF